MKYSVWSKILSSYSIPEAARMIKSAGYDGVEWRIHDEGHMSLAEVVEKATYLKEITTSEGLEIVTLGSYIQAKEIDDFRHLAEAASRANCKNVRVWAPFYDGTVDYYALLNDTRENVAKLQDAAREFGVRAVFEIHFGTIIPSASLARRLLEGFDPLYVAAIYDPGNMVNEGMENWKMGIQVLGEYLGYVHFKNAGWFHREPGRPGGPSEFKGGNGWRGEWVPINGGIVDWEKVMSSLVESGFDGYLSNENFSDIPIQERLVGDLRYLKEIEKKVRQ